MHDIHSFSTSVRWLAQWLVAAATAGALAGAAVPAQAADAAALEAANHAYYWGRFGESLAAYERLAAQGDAEAAERAGFMLLQGQGFYGAEVRRDVGRATALLTQASRAGRGGAGFLLGMLERTD